MRALSTLHFDKLEFHRPNEPSRSHCLPSANFRSRVADRRSPYSDRSARAAHCRAALTTRSAFPAPGTQSIDRRRVCASHSSIADRQLSERLRRRAGEPQQSSTFAESFALRPGSIVQAVGAGWQSVFRRPAHAPVALRRCDYEVAD